MLIYFDFAELRMECTERRTGHLVALYELGALDERDEARFRDHLVECDYCYSEVYSMEPAMAAFRRAREAARTARDASTRVVKGRTGARFSPETWFRGWGPLSGIPALAALCLLVVAGAGAIYLVVRASRGGGAGSSDGQVAMNTSWKDFQIPKASYAAPPANLTLRGPNEAFERAMAAYEANDFKAAIEQLETLREVAPANAADVNFYLGVSRLLTGDAHDSIAPLEKAVDMSNGARREAAHYYLALGLAKDDQPKQAVVELDKTIESGGEHRDAANALRQRIIDAVK